MKKYVFLFSLPLMLLGIAGKAQDTIGMGYSKPFGLRDTVQASSLDTFSVVVKNFGATAFNDTLTISGAVRDSVSPGNFVFHQIGSYKTYNAVSLAASDSVVIPLTALYTIDTVSSYHPGINVIVIWPVAQSAKTIDSLIFNVYIIGPNGINEIDLKQLIKVFPNPASDHFTIENTAKIDIEEVRIYDAVGRLINCIKGQSVINTEDWPVGEYLMELQLSNKQRHSIRIIKQK